MLKWIKSATALAMMVGFVFGVGAVIAVERIDHYTDTDAFCTSCHLTGEYIAKSEVYLTSSHRSRASGVEPGCADCHIPKGLIPSTWTHFVKGIQDLYGQITYDYEDIHVWQERRPELAYAVRDWMRATDSVTCRSCHDEASIEPKRRRGQQQHEDARIEGMTCIDCHYNLVHEEVEPRQSFLDGAGRQQ